MSIYYAIKYTISRNENGNGDETEQGKNKAAAAAILRRLDPIDDDEAPETDDGRDRRLRKEDMVLNQWEQAVALDIVAPDDIPVTFEGKMHAISSPLFSDTDQSLLLRYWRTW